MLTCTCRSIVDEAFARHRRALAAVARGVVIRASTGGRWRICARGCRVSARSGSSHSVDISRARTRWQRGGVLEARRDLFPRLDTVIAYKLLFGIYSGIVPDGIDDLAASDID
jgi:hypothetical protein